MDKIGIKKKNMKYLYLFKKTWTIIFCTQYLPSFKVLRLDDKNLLLFELYMNKEEKKAFSCYSLTMKQVIRLKLQLQKDNSLYTVYFWLVQYDDIDTKVVLEETFEKIWNIVFQYKDFKYNEIGLLYPTKYFQ